MDIASKMDLIGRIIAIVALTVVVVYLAKNAPMWFDMRVSKTLSYVVFLLLTIGALAFLTPEAHVLGLGTVLGVGIYLAVSGDVRVM